ncbi:MAG: UDP-N-acetylmuramoyl-tripeptide--D-alanyl-D-alanine ligase [Phycisphaerales bacterium]
MSGAAFLRASEIRAAVAGSWIRRPTSDVVPSGVSIDTREDLARKLFVAIRGERFDGNDFASAASQAGAAVVVVDRDVRVAGDAAVLYVPDARRALGQLAAAWRATLERLRVVAITGSAGKTTTRRLIDGVLGVALVGTASPKSFNNDIGVPLTLLAARRGDEYLVVEIGMNRPGEIHALATLAKPHVAVITMVGRAHLQGLGTVEAIAREKTSLLETIAPDGAAIVHGDGDLIAAAMAARDLSPQRRLRFGASRERPLELRLTGRRPTSDGQDIEVNGGERFALRLPGEHNAVNALAAIAVGREFGLTDNAIRIGLASVEPAGMRLERIEVPLDAGAITFFNDAYNANPDAMAASIRAFAEISQGARRRVLVLGDMLELGDASASLHREVGAVAAQVSSSTHIAAVVLVGAFAEDTLRGLRDGGWDGEALVLDSLEPADVARARRCLVAGDAVLLKGSRGSRMERLLAEYAASAL